MKRASVLLALAAMAASTLLVAPARAAARHRAVFELSSDNPASWNAVLNNLENVQQRFGASQTELELVAFGPGIGFMLKSNQALSERMAALSRRHVVFTACQNTMKARHISPSDLLPFVQLVPSGVAEIILKQEAGWAYLKAGV